MSLLTPGAEPVPGYILDKRLGRGGFGEVWRATAPGGFHVAMKFISAKESEGAVELRALETIRNIRHPHLLDVQFAVHKDGWLIIAMPLCDRSLIDRLQECRDQLLPGIPVPELIGYMHECAKALDFLNERRHKTSDGKVIGIQHRDVKPHNIFLVGESARVADFGLVKAVESSTASHTSGMTPHYAPPEMFKKSIAKTSDQYSLAITYYHLRTGNLPFTGSSHQVMYGHLERDPDLSALPTSERAVIAKALSKQPRDRWRTCQEMVAQLERAATPSHASDKTTKDAQVRVIPSPKRKPRQRHQRAQPASGIVQASDSNPGLKQGVHTNPPRLAEPTVKSTANESDTIGEEHEPFPSGSSAHEAIFTPQQIVIIAASAIVLTLILVVGVVLMLPDTDQGVAETPSKAAPTTVPATKPRPGDVVSNSIGMKLAYIPSGEFLMGGETPVEEIRRNFKISGGSVLQSEFPVHRVQITKPFYLSVHEVTVGQFRQFVNDAHYTTEAEKNGKGGYGFEGSIVNQDRRYNWENYGTQNSDRHPVANVSWVDANQFCLWLSRVDKARYRLPTEAEWEYACRAGTSTRYYNGDVDQRVVDIANVKDAAFHDHFIRSGEPDFAASDGAAHASEVGRYQPNAFGLHDMLGNVREWCADRFDQGYYAASGPLAVDPQGPTTGELRVTRGGSFLESRASARCAARTAALPNALHAYIGFRVVKEAPGD